MIVIAEHDRGVFVKTERLNELTPEHDVLGGTLSNVCMSEIIDRVNIIDGLKINEFISREGATTMDSL
jgi:hypothetical protein